MAAVARRSTVGSFGALGGRVPTCSAWRERAAGETDMEPLPVFGVTAARTGSDDGVRSNAVRWGRRRRSGLRGQGYEQFGFGSLQDRRCA